MNVRRISLRCNSGHSAGEGSRDPVYEGPEHDLKPREDDGSISADVVLPIQLIPVANLGSAAGSVEGLHDIARALAQMATRNRLRSG